MTMNNTLAFIVVEDRQNKSLLMCRESAARAQEPLIVLAGTDAGPGYERLCRTYVHLSSNPPEFEKICFRRYFLLSEYLRAHPEHREFVLIDSDVLLFRGVGAHIRRVAGKADFSGSYMRPSGSWDPCQISPHVSYWTAAGLQQFVAFLLNTYATPTGRRRLRAIAARFAARGVRGGVSDMTLLHLWAHASGNAAPINRVFGGRVIDHNINGGHNLLANEFQGRGGAKRLVFVDGQPCLVTPAGELVNVLALHFQGSAKIAMAHVLHGRVRTVALLTAALRLGRRAKNWAFGMRQLAQRPAGGARFAGAAGPK
ncbi:hypothetical protein QFZ47_004685 [Variovorax paradoxus]|nr:hypothetical protein [Variovorax paradoxus]